MQDPVFVLDIGSHTIKVGLSTSEKPDFIIPSVFPLNNHSFPINEKIPEDSELDDLAFEGEIVNNDRMTFLLVSIYDKYFPESQPISPNIGFVFTNTPEASISHLEFLSEQAFGVCGAARILVKSQSAFSLLPYQYDTCICLDIGHDVAQATAYCGGSVSSVVRSSLAGSALDLFTARVIMGIEDFVSYKEYKEVQQTKQEKAKVAPSKDFDHSDKALLCGEVLFDPKIMLQSAVENDTDVEELSKQPSVVELINSTVQKCDSKYHNDLWSHIIVTGGTSLLNGFKERLVNEIILLNKDAKLIFSDNPIISAWKGAAFVANNDNNKDDWLYADDFDKDPSLVFSKF